MNVDKISDKSQQMRLTDIGFSKEINLKQKYISFHLKSGASKNNIYETFLYESFHLFWINFRKFSAELFFSLIRLEKKKVPNTFTFMFCNPTSIFIKHITPTAVRKIIWVEILSLISLNRQTIHYFFNFYVIFM